MTQCYLSMSLQCLSRPLVSLLCPSDNSAANTQPFNGPLPGTTRVGRYQKEHSPTHTHPDHRSSFINFLHLLGSTASSLFSLRAWQSFPQTLSRSSLVFLLVWNSLLHTFLHPITIFLQRYVVIVYVCKC